MLHLLFPGIQRRWHISVENEKKIKLKHSEKCWILSWVTSLKYKQKEGRKKTDCVE